MPRIYRVLSMGVVALVLLFAGHALAEGGGIWPFSKTVTKTTKKSSPMTSWSSSSSSQNKTPGKSSKTWSETLMPWKKPAPQAAVPYGNLGRSVSSAPKEPEKKSSFANWFQKEEPKPPPRSLGEWMSLERIDP